MAPPTTVPRTERMGRVEWNGRRICLEEGGRMEQRNEEWTKKEEHARRRKLDGGAKKVYEC